MMNPFFLNNEILLKIARHLVLCAKLELQYNSETLPYDLAKHIQSQIIQKLQAIFQFAAKETNDENYKIFFNTFSRADFENSDKLQTVEENLSNVSTELNTNYLNTMWYTRRPILKKLVASNIPATLFFKNEFKPKTEEEIALNQKQLEAEEKVEQAKLLICYLKLINSMFSYTNTLSTEIISAPAA